MATHTTRDRVWNAALEYAKEWNDLEAKRRRHKYGFTAPELKEIKELEASEKTIHDTLATMADMGYFNSVGGRGGESAQFSW